MKCHDCHVESGMYHIHGCDVERCPRCGGQMISCNCIYEVNGIDVTKMEETHPNIWMEGPTREMLEEWDKHYAEKRIPYGNEIIPNQPI